MIEQITGTIIHKSPTFCVLENNGIGFGIHITLNAFELLDSTAAGESVVLHTYLHVREDALQLYGFASAEEKHFFKLLLGISGVGPRLAQAILSGMAPDRLREAIQLEDVASITRIPGVGKKTAQRIVLELKEKLKSEEKIERIQEKIAPGSANRQAMEAVLALVALGYKENEAEKAVRVVLSRKNDVSLEELIKEALKEV